MKNKTLSIPYKRKRIGKTDYRKRLKMLVSGSPRLIVRKTNKNMVVQVAKYSEKGDNVVATAVSLELKKLGWKHSTSNIPAAYLTGLLIAKKSKSKKVTSAIVDLGLQTPKAGSKLYAVVKGAIDGGLEIPCSEEVFPSEDRLTGKHVADYGKISKQFKTSPADIQADFKKLKDQISK